MSKGENKNRGKQPSKNQIGDVMKTIAKFSNENGDSFNAKSFSENLYRFFPGKITKNRCDAIYKGTRHLNKQLASLRIEEGEKAFYIHAIKKDGEVRFSSLPKKGRNPSFYL